MERFAAPALEARTLEDAIAVLNIATSSGGDGPAGAGAGAAYLGSSMSGGSGGGGGSALPMSPGAEDMHPERRMKAAYQRYKEKNLPELKEEYPSLRMSQLLEMLNRNWSKSPENPLVQAARAKDMTNSSWKQGSGAGNA